MKKTTGYLDDKGNFHKTEKECRISNLKIKLNKTEEFFRKLESKISSEILVNINTAIDDPTEEPFNLHNIFEYAILKASYYLIKYPSPLEEVTKVRKEIEQLYDLIGYEKLNWWQKIFISKPEEHGKVD